MYCVLWQYKVTVENQQHFEKKYGVGGVWHALFSTSTDYLGSQLCKNVDDPQGYVLLDTWKSRDAYVDFLKKQEEAYQHLSKQLEDLYVKEIRLGDFESANVTL